MEGIDWRTKGLIFKGKAMKLERIKAKVFLMNQVQGKTSLNRVKCHKEILINQVTSTIKISDEQMLPRRIHKLREVFATLKTSEGLERWPSKDHFPLLQRDEMWFPEVISGSSQTLAMPVPWDLMPSSALSRHLNAHAHTQAHTQTCKIKNIILGWEYSSVVEHLLDT